MSRFYQAISFADAAKLLQNLSLTPKRDTNVLLCKTTRSSQLLEQLHGQEQYALVPIDIPAESIDFVEEAPTPIFNFQTSEKLHIFNFHGSIPSDWIDTNAIVYCL